MFDTIEATVSRASVTAVIEFSCSTLLCVIYANPVMESFDDIFLSLKIQTNLSDENMLKGR